MAPMTIPTGPGADQGRNLLGPAPTYLPEDPEPQRRLDSGDDPAAVVARLRVPVLVVQGSTDIQADTGDARRLAAASPRATLRVIDGMNHVLKLVSAERAAQLASYSDPALPVAPALVDAVATFVSAPTR